MPNTLLNKEQYYAEVVQPIVDSIRMARDEQRIAAELHRRAQRIVDRVVAEAMENVRKTLKKP